MAIQAVKEVAPAQAAKQQELKVLTPEEQLKEILRMHGRVDELRAEREEIKLNARENLKTLKGVEMELSNKVRDLGGDAGVLQQKFGVVAGGDSKPAEPETKPIAAKAK